MKPDQTLVTQRFIQVGNVFRTSLTVSQSTSEGSWTLMSWWVLQYSSKVFPFSSYALEPKVTAYSSSLSSLANFFRWTRIHHFLWNNLVDLCFHHLLCFSPLVHLRRNCFAFMSHQALRLCHQSSFPVLWPLTHRISTSIGRAAILLRISCK